MTQVATISTTNWIITIVALLVIIGLDFAWAVARREKDTSMREATVPKPQNPKKFLVYLNSGK